MPDPEDLDLIWQDLVSAINGHGSRTNSRVFSTTPILPVNAHSATVGKFVQRGDGSEDFLGYATCRCGAVATNLFNDLDEVVCRRHRRSDAHYDLNNCSMRSTTSS
jgi:hypothetical protein